jgi:hypothetical protein
MTPANLGRVGINSCAALSIIVAAIAPAAAYGQTKTQNVNVVNPTTNPVNAQITNLVVPVEVRNADPIPVSAAEDRGEIIRFTGHQFVSDFEVPCDPDGYRVPSGKTLVVEQISVSAAMPQTSVTRAVLDTQTTTMDLAWQTQFPGIANGVSLSQQVTFYASENEVVNLRLVRTSTGTSGISCTIIGRLVDAF